MSAEVRGQIIDPDEFDTILVSFSDMFQNYNTDELRKHGYTESDFGSLLDGLSKRGQYLHGVYTELCL